MDELYRNYRIAVRQAETWSARITHVRGPVVPTHATATLEEGSAVCLARARQIVDRYIAFLDRNEPDRE